MTIVYVLTATKDNLYREQSLISLYSLRQYDDCPVVILTDDKTAPLVGEDFKALGAQIKVIDFPDTVDCASRSRLIKTTIPNYITPPFLYIDCDTVICDKISNKIFPNCSIAGVLDGHTTLENHIHKNYFLSRDKKLGFTATKKLGFNVNGGVIYCGRGGEKLFSKWNELWKECAKKGDKHDQSPLNEAILEIYGDKKDEGFSLLNGEWNCQPSHGGLQFLENAKIIHYYSSEFGGKSYTSYYKLGDPTLQESIRTGLTDEVKSLIRHGKFCFNSTHLVSDKRVISIMQSPLLFTLADMKEHTPIIFNLLESAAKFIRTLGKKIIKLRDK